jgi:hypothetical protein
MMSESSVALFHDLLESPAFVEAFKEFVTIETEIRFSRLRAFLRAGDIETALVAEGEATAIEDLPGLIAQYAKSYRAPAKF